MLSTILSVCMLGFGLGNASLATAGEADPIAQLLGIKDVPVPAKRPSNLRGFSAEADDDALDNSAVGSVTSLARKGVLANSGPVAVSRNANVGANAAALGGTLGDGLDALQDKDATKALGIRESLPAGSLERRLLSWAIALSGLSGISSGEIARTANELTEWPGQQSMRINSEVALASEHLPPQAIIAAFVGRQPESVSGAIALAQSYLSVGDKNSANLALRPFWRENRLLASTEKRILSEAGDALTPEDHRKRMLMLFYSERAKDGLRMAPLAGMEETAKAWTAVLRDDGKAGELLDALPDAQKADPAYLFMRAKLARKSGDPQAAAKFIEGAPRDADALVDPDEWWVERRLVSRALIDAGDAQSAYNLAAAHSAESAAVAAEAEFHAGWYALRFLKDPKLAIRHFDRLLRVSSTPISQARGHYWKAQALGPIAGARIWPRRHTTTRLSTASLRSSNSAGASWRSTIRGRAQRSGRISPRANWCAPSSCSKIPARPGGPTSSIAIWPSV